MALDKEKITGRINKLIALAEGSSNEHEAASAMAKARAMMDKYQIEEMDLIKGRASDADFSVGQASRAFHAVPAHLSVLAVAVAKFNDVIASFEVGHEINFKKNDNRQNKYGKIIVFKGFNDDVAAAITMFERLVDVTNDLCAGYLKANGHTGRYPVGIGGAFKKGCVSTISARLSAFGKEREELKTGNGTSLVACKTSAVEEYFGRANYGNAKSSKLDDASAHAYFSGAAQANHVDLNNNQKLTEE